MLNIPNNTIFPATMVPPSIIAEYCKELWNVTTPSAAALRHRYHFTQDDIAESTRIIFSQGQYDPTTSLGPLSLPHTSDRNATKILYVSDMAHREDLFFPNPDDRKTTIQVRLLENDLTYITYLLTFH